uniref:Uncharacterized protein n=1 Tax=Aegilops tauschii TaxID=37682 RepID=M8C4F0_AEGTA
MKITVHSSKAVKPDYGACGVAPASTADVVPLTVLDKANFDTYISVIYAFRASAPPNAVLEAGLARALVDYREWAGRLGVDPNGERAIMLNDAGARFMEATADVALDSVMPLKPTPEVLNLHPSGDDGPEELMLIQGLLILLPSFLGDGSVDAYVPLLSRDMNTFKNCCYTLD